MSKLVIASFQFKLYDLTTVGASKEHAYANLVAEVAKYGDIPMPDIDDLSWFEVDTENLTIDDRKVAWL